MEKKKDMMHKMPGGMMMKDKEMDKMMADKKMKKDSKKMMKSSDGYMKAK